MSLSRRAFLRGVAASAVVPLGVHAQGSVDPQLFQHGVASGDPLADRVILWSRVTPPATRSAIGPIEVTWIVASDDRLAQVVARGTAAAAPERDFTVKVDAAGLQPGRTYFYAFTAGGQRSPVGRTRTLPAAGVDRVRLAVVSCSNYPAGYFNAYARIAERSDVDAVLHLGDYIYEFADGIYGDDMAIGRVPLPAGEAVTLTDYRLRYAIYRSDPDLREAHRLHPFIVVWDDHESADNAWAGGATSHEPSTEGSWSTRLAAAYRAYVEWLPVRETSPEMYLYRSFRIGDLADLVMLDTRAFRDRHPQNATELNDARRSMLGAAQEAWLFGELRASAKRDAAWRLIGQQVLFSSMTPPGAPPLSVDMWDGYPAARTRVLDMLAADRIGDVAILTGDLHSSWAFDVPANPWATPGRPATRSLAVEVVTPAISSPPLFTDPALRNRAPAFRTRAPHLRYLDGDGQGYVLLDVTRQRLQVDWYFVETVSDRTARESKAASFVCQRGTSRFTSA